jgi:hypothetical protein
MWLQITEVLELFLAKLNILIKASLPDWGSTFVF